MVTTKVEIQWIIEVLQRDKDVGSTLNQNDPQTPTIIGVEAWGTDEVLLSKDMASKVWWEEGDGMEECYEK